MNRKVKIVATVGPSSRSESVIKQLILNGMNVARLNFSHGTHEEHLSHIRIIRKLSTALGVPIPILQDLQGPKMRVGIIAPDGIQLLENEIIQFSEGKGRFVPRIDPEYKVIPLDVPNLSQIVHPGMRILLDDGKIETQVERVDEKIFYAKVVIGGTIFSKKGVNLPGEALEVESFTDKDRKDLLLGLENGVDLIACSFVRSVNDILKIKNTIAEAFPENKTPIIAKLERPEAIRNLDGIMKITEGVMVARGDLGVETSPSDVPILQKEIIKTANLMGKLVITATQMLESMMYNTRPTRAEASDIANAVFDGTDAVMLSGETASGKFPVESIRMMDQIVCEAEEHTSEWGKFDATESEQSGDAFNLSHAAKALASNRKASAIVVFTLSGKTALFMSKVRPNTRILAFTPIEETYRNLSLYWGVTPFLVPFSKTIEEMITTVDRAILHDSILTPGEPIVMISGLPVHAMRKPNLILLHALGEQYQP